MPLTGEILAVVSVFETAFCQPTWVKLQVILIGTILARGRRTVTAALRQMGLGNESNYSKYHQVFNRASWSSLELGKRLLNLLKENFEGSVKIVIDEHLERRQGRKIRKLGKWRDPLISSPVRSVSREGLRWIVMALVVKLPWTSRNWALPFFAAPTTTPSVSAKLQKRHKKTADWAIQMIKIVRRWLPATAIKLVGDSSYSVIELGHNCARLAVTLTASLRLDARLFEAPPPRKPKGQNRRGRPAGVGKVLPKLQHRLDDARTPWLQMKVKWYDGTQRLFDYTAGTALWYCEGHKPLPIAWVLVRDPEAQLKPRAFFSTDQSQTPDQILADFIDRWTIEVTFEESRSHIGIQTQRQWSDLAIDRITPCLFGLYSLICLFANELFPTGKLPIQSTAWYQKSEPTFADVLAEVRRSLWGDFNFPRSEFFPDRVLIPAPLLNRLAQAVCYTH